MGFNYFRIEFSCLCHCSCCIACPIKQLLSWTLKTRFKSAKIPPILFKQLSTPFCEHLHKIGGYTFRQKVSVFIFGVIMWHSARPKAEKIQNDDLCGCVRLDNKNKKCGCRSLVPLILFKSSFERQPQSLFKVF